MAITFITVDELRNAVGRVSRDPTETAHVTDSELQAIIDRHRANTEALIERRVEERMVEGTIAGDDIFEQQTISLSPDGPFAVGDIPEVEFYPITSQTAWGPSGGIFTYDRSLDSQINTFFSRRRYRLIGDKLHVIPKDTTELTVYLPNRTKTNNRIGAGDVENANTRIIKETQMMVEQMVRQGSRLEGTDYYGSDRDQ